MRNLKKCGAAAALPRSSDGLAFEIADLIRSRCWADAHDFRMTVRLDHRATVGDNYDEVIAFQTMTSPLYRFIVWRDANSVHVQPLVGKERQYSSVAAALDSLLPKHSLSVN
jgi:hypothetical protein